MRMFPSEIIRAHGITLRELRETDVPDIALACSDELTLRWLLLPTPYTVDDAREFASEIAPRRRKSGLGLECAIEVDGQFHGVIGLSDTDWDVSSTEAGYWLAPWGRGRGVMARALAALTDWALFERGLARVQVQVATGNVPSLAVARRAGFVAEGVRRKAGRTHAGPVDLMVFSRLVEDGRVAFRETLPPL